MILPCCTGNINTSHMQNMRFAIAIVFEHFGHSHVVRMTCIWLPHNMHQPCIPLSLTWHTQHSPRIPWGQSSWPLAAEGRQGAAPGVSDVVKRNKGLRPLWFYARQGAAPSFSSTNASDRGVESTFCWCCSCSLSDLTAESQSCFLTDFKLSLP